MADYIRARSPEHKQERMEAIMAAADALFAERPYHQITMGTIAEKLGWSRSSLYKYAATQEEIFLSLHSAKNRAWIDDLAASLDGAPLPAEQCARTWAEVTERHASLLRYQEILISIIESNVTFERLVEFKRAFAEMLPPVTDVLGRQCAQRHGKGNLPVYAVAEVVSGIVAGNGCAVGIQNPRIFAAGDH